MWWRPASIASYNWHRILMEQKATGTAGGLPVKGPLTLIILDGWGYREEHDHNAIALANTPNWDRLWAESPHATVISAAP